MDAMQSHSIEYVLKKSRRARGLRISVYCDGSISVTAPAHADMNAVERFVAEKSSWIREKLREFMPFRPVVRRKSSRAEYLRHKEAARSLVEKRLTELNRPYGFSYGKVSIRNQKSRWGSCSIRGNLNFNYRLALIPARLSDYVMVHELCHLGQFDHSQAFWDLVARAIPDYRARRAELRRFSLAAL